MDISHASFEITRPDDCHLHLRDGSIMQAVVVDSAKQFGKAIIMPNLSPPITTTEAAIAYRKRIMENIPIGCNFEPLMTLYLTKETTPEEIHIAKQSSFVVAVKFYPAGATTNSSFGVENLMDCAPVLEKLQESGMPLLLHGEIVNPQIDMFDREKKFIDLILLPLRHFFPKLKIVLEHITTREAVDFINQDRSDLIAGTITAQHILMNRNSLFDGGIRPQNYCLPLLKREEHRLAVLEAATSGSKKFFLGTDSAPHIVGTKECSCGCAGCYTAMHALSLYAEAFDSVDKLDYLEGFASFYGADFYGFPRNTEKVSLVKEFWRIPFKKNVNDTYIVPLKAGERIGWRFENSSLSEST